MKRDIIQQVAWTLSLCSAVFATSSVPELRVLLEHVTPLDARLYLNLLYYSYARSAITLATQDAALCALQELTTQWNGCSLRRLDPSKAPEDHSPIIAQERFAQLRAKFHLIHSSYHYVVTCATRPNSFQNLGLAQNVVLMRNEARTVVIEAVRSIAHQVKEALNELIAELPASRLIMNEEPTRVPISELFVNMIGAYSFVELNAMLIQTHDFLSTQCEKAQEYTNLMWHTIEMARMKFYATQFNNAYEILKSLSFPTETFSYITELINLPSESGHQNIPAIALPLEYDRLLLYKLS